jgi:proteasome lid subunit RPN8/RPN11
MGSTPNTLAGSARQVRLPPAVRAQIEAWAAAVYPHEACGLLLGRAGATAVPTVPTVIDRAHLARNLDSRARDHYEIDPADHLAAEDQARALGLDVVGVWHSHPDHPALPSETDRQGAWPGWSYVILAVAAGSAAGLRSWRLDGERFAEEELLG